MFGQTGAGGPLDATGVGLVGVGVLFRPQSSNACCCVSHPTNCGSPLLSHVGCIASTQRRNA
jgi:hypothetical protein